MTQPLWQPHQDAIDITHMAAFKKAASLLIKKPLPTYQDLYQWSIDEPQSFWKLVWTFCNLKAETQGDIALKSPGTMFKSSWFPNARLNYAENLLTRRDQATAIVFWAEDQIKRSLSFAELYAISASCASALKASGVQEGDRVAAIMPNMPETVIAMLGATSLGAIWSSCSPDFGTTGVLDRFAQISPKILITVDGYLYNGKIHDCLNRIPEILSGLPTVEKVIIIPYMGQISQILKNGAQNSLQDPIKAVLDKIPNSVIWDDFLLSHQDADFEFKQFPFNHPLFILFSSGTTGAPKCIVHGAGGTLLQHLKEHQLHCDIHPNDKVFYYTTCGWMMWNWQVSALASEATIMLYEGSPFHPSSILWDYAETEGITHFGTSAKYIDALHKADIKPIESHSLPNLRMIVSTGSPLAPSNFEYVYRNVASNICLASVSGGTDIISCFALGNPIDPVWAGELQTRGLGMKVEVWDEQGRTLKGEKGELVCCLPFPSMPISFWGDPGDEKYKSAYFERFPEVWCHGDFVELTEHQGLVIYGRSDTVLNPGGVRIGTAEIYRQVEQIPELLESLAVGQEWQDDVRVILFVRLRENVILTETLTHKIKGQIRQHCTPRHVPAKIIQVADIPRTKSGKMVELAVREMIHGREIKNISSLANPEALELYKNLKELQE